MSEAVSNPFGELRAALAAAVGELDDGLELDEATLERPPRAELGDYSTNAALLAAPALGATPREIAGQLGDALASRLGDAVSRVEVAGPGFLNISLTDGWLRSAVAAILAAGERFGSGGLAPGRRVLVEFVSANPTGPLTVASGRHAAYGDSLARVLGFAGERVEREYYSNDTGGQIALFGRSIAARMSGAEVPEGGYEGDYVAEIARELEAAGLGPDDLEQLEVRGVELISERIAATLERFRVGFDRWSSQRELEGEGAIDAAVERLRADSRAYESEGAVWLRTTEFGDDKDRVLIRAGGEPTYFAADIAYHRDKLTRTELIINVLGADHHGYVGRMRAAIAALGGDTANFETPIMQLVHLVEGGERARMSKRRGEFATLDELVDDIGVDAARFFLLQRSHDTAIEVDLELARRRSNENPVYYVQYAHARIASIFRTAAERGAVLDPDGGGAVEGAERALIARLLAFPEQVNRAAVRREPHGLAAYGRELAADFHAFYRDCRVVGAPPGLEGSRLALSAAARQVVATTLGLLGIEAPEEM